MNISNIQIVRTLWTNKFAPKDWNEKYLYPEIPYKPSFKNEIVYVWGDYNIKLLEERGYNCVKMEDNQYPWFEQEFTQHGKKLVALDKALQEFDEVLMLDWDCIQTKEISIDKLREKETQVPLYCWTEPQLLKIKQYYKSVTETTPPLEEELRKYHWKLDDILVSPNFGFVYSRDKNFAKRLIEEAIKNKINYCIEEHAMFKYADCTLDEYIEKYHPTTSYGRALPFNKSEIGSVLLNEYVNNKIGINEYFKHL